MMPRPIIMLAAALAALLAAGPVLAQDPANALARLNERLVAVEANAQYSGLAAYERLQARQALDALEQA